MAPEGESAEGFIVYMDRNENDQPDEYEPKTETDAQGNHQWEFEHFDDFHPNKLKIQPAEGEYFSAIPQPGRKTNQNKSPIMITDADFKIVKKPPDKPPEGDPTGTEEKNPEEEFPVVTADPEKNPEEEFPVVTADPEDNPDGFLRQLGFEPAPDEPKTKGEEKPDESGENIDVDEKPLWIFKVDPDLPKSFNTARSQYNKAQKKEKWDENLSRLNAEIATQTAYANSLHSEAKNARSKTDRENATESAQHADERLGKLEAQRAELQEAKNNLFEPYKMAARALTEEQQRYEADSVKQAADKLGVKIGPVPKRNQKLWKEAALFNAEITLTTLGLIKAKRGWQPSGLTEFRDRNQKIQKAEAFFAPYLQKKK
ncbi:MAG TPA: hypothetical protein QF772_09910, partial [Nitrospinaceae bacterium]|nr:hypothetical protein [Nitrospinaceae bacterium]